MKMEVSPQATARQQKFLRDLGWPGDPGRLTKAQARAMIEQLLDPDQARARRFLQLTTRVQELEAGLQEAREELTRWKLPPEAWRAMVALVHPDRHFGGALEAEAGVATRWLLERRPAKARH